jgi:uroporphyrinogen decarboxylase
MPPLSSRERIARILRHEPVDRVGCYEHFWTQTARRWEREGRVATGCDLNEHFNHDIGQSRPFNMVADIAFGRKVIEETDDAIRYLDGNGAVLLKNKKEPGPARYVDFSVRDRAAWEERIKPLLRPARGRIDFVAYRQARDRAAAGDRFFCLGNRLIFQVIEMFCGHEHLLAGMALDPEWAVEMASTCAELHLGLMEMLFDDAGAPDAVWFNEDLGFKEKPFMSPRMYAEIFQPFHRRVFGWLHGRGVPVIVHSCGFMEPMVGGLVEAGMDCLQVIEVKAGMGPVRLRERFGDRLALCGGMDARTLIANDRAAVRRELKAKLPLLKGPGGYILHSDHSITDEVEYETYACFLREGLKLGHCRG